MNGCPPGGPARCIKVNLQPLKKASGSSHTFVTNWLTRGAGLVLWGSILSRGLQNQREYGRYLIHPGPREVAGKLK